MFLYAVVHKKRLNVKMDDVNKC